METVRREATPGNGSSDSARNRIECRCRGLWATATAQRGSRRRSSCTWCMIRCRNHSSSAWSARSRETERPHPRHFQTGGAPSCASPYSTIVDDRHRGHVRITHSPPSVVTLCGTRQPTLSSRRITRWIHQFNPSVVDHMPWTRGGRRGMLWTANAVRGNGCRRPVPPAAAAAVVDVSRGKEDFRPFPGHHKGGMLGQCGHMSAWGRGGEP
jgi:hypothetical protein